MLSLRLPKSLPILIVAVAATVARADETKTLSGTFKGDSFVADNLPLELELDGSPALLAALKETVAEQGDRRVTIVVSEVTKPSFDGFFSALKARAKLVAISGKTGIQAPLLDASGNPTTGNLDARTRVTIRDAKDVTLPDGSKRSYLLVRTSSGAEGWMPATYVEVGTGSGVGSLIGFLTAKGFELGTRIRGARFFHPTGRVYVGKVASLNPPEPFAKPAKRLEGEVIARLGGGWFKMDGNGKEPATPDVPGMALRFTSPGAGATIQASPEDMDVLFTSYTERFRTLISGIGFFKTDAHNFFPNDFFPDVPFRAAELGDVWFRLKAKDGRFDDIAGASRDEKFENAVKTGQVAFVLSAQRVNASWTREHLGLDVPKLAKTLSWTKARAANPWVPLVEITFTAKVPMDQTTHDRFHFHPGLLEGRGWRAQNPIVTEWRDEVYAASQQEDDRRSTGAKTGPDFIDPVVDHAVAPPLRLTKGLIDALSPKDKK